MRLHRNLAVIACCALLLARGFGLHAHAAPEAEGREAVTVMSHADAQLHSHDHGQAHRAIIAVGDPGHLDRHLAHGEVDVDLPGATSGKLPSVPLGLALPFLAVAVLPPRAGSPSPWAAFRPPAGRRWLHVLPPSQAPPSAG